MPDIRDMVAGQTAKMVAEALEARQKELLEIPAAAWMAGQDEFATWEDGHKDLPLQDRLKHFQECMARHMMDAAMKTFQLGYTAGMDLAFDIVEAKAIEMGGVPDGIN